MKTRRPVAPLVFSDLRLVVDQPIAKCGSTRLAFEGPK